MILWQILPLSALLLMCLVTLTLTNGVNSCITISDYVSLDSFGFCLSVIPLFSVLSLIVLLGNELSAINVWLILLSSASSLVCFNCNNFMLFFVSYELSIIFLLFSLFTGSPYSERGLAGWYFLGYLVIGGVPLLLLCIYNSLNSGELIVHDPSSVVNYILFLLFITKVPLFPFHSWLPIVHAEANSYVSIMLSGYIMKLGILGVVRLFSSSGELIKVYVMMFFLASCYFLVSSVLELDNKRWLAFLSLGHISVGVLGILSIPHSNEYLISSFSLGHGLSVIFLFLYFSVQSGMVGSRNWVVMLNSNNSGMVGVIALGVLSLIAFPPSILFFNEVFIFVSSISTQSVSYVFYLYILLGVIAPICILSVILSRLSSTSDLNCFSINYISLLCGMVIFYLYFIII
uniref:NADH-ubiquinone oxidoreductase chain 4 n=1 Tax=Gyrodactylus brachymystacis TaxID=369907 RepID=A0A1C8FMV0_9PLAT|nr:NADH dehydrogenase subunit 4 [Gyrodactylus brachymystacis]AMO02261.1 NADH dehydrogenase subunit 4 [Gyrodactylus brachymystacis]